MSCPQLDTLVFQSFELLEDGGQIPVLGNVVGDDSELRHDVSPRPPDEWIRMEYRLGIVAPVPAPDKTQHGRAIDRSWADQAINSRISSPFDPIGMGRPERLRN